MSDPIRECIENFGPAPRTLPLWDRVTYLRVPRPQWLRAYPTDRLRILFQHMGSLWRDGTVVWGHIVQANTLLFEDRK